MPSFEINNSKITLFKGDITKFEVDIIVNSANTGLMQGGGVCGAIYRAAGEGLQAECDKAKQEIGGSLKTGHAVVTPAGELKAKHIIHTVGPVWRGGSRGEPELLRSSYEASLKLADEKGAKNIAFPSISSGIYGYPLFRAAPIAVKAIADYLMLNDDTAIKEVMLVLYDQATFEAYEEALKNF
jgi:O-acetyl-ADP-ribose deacetylase (regulator of RNase III)